MIPKNQQLQSSAYGGSRGGESWDKWGLYYCVNHHSPDIINLIKKFSITEFLDNFVPPETSEEILMRQQSVITEHVYYRPKDQVYVKSAYGDPCTCQKDHFSDGYCKFLKGNIWDESDPRGTLFLMKLKEKLEKESNKPDDQEDDIVSESSSTESWEDLAEFEKESPKVVEGEIEKKIEEVEKIEKSNDKGEKIIQVSEQMQQEWENGDMFFGYKTPKKTEKSNVKDEKIVTLKAKDFCVEGKTGKILALNRDSTPNGLCFVLFYSHECEKCQKFLPIFRKLSREFPTQEKCHFAIVNVKEEKEILKHETMPYMVLYFDNSPFMRYVGPREYKEICRFLCEVNKLNKFRNKTGEGWYLSRSHYVCKVCKAGLKDSSDIMIYILKNVKTKKDLEEDEVEKGGQTSIEDLGELEKCTTRFEIAKEIMKSCKINKKSSERLEIVDARSAQSSDYSNKIVASFDRGILTMRFPDNK